MLYRRVIPRDLFNEAKLLKCLGQLSLLLHDYEGRWPIELEHTYPETGFVVGQSPASGGLFCDNVVLRFKDGGKRIVLHSNYNSTAAYPLSFYDAANGEGSVFNDDGTFHADFLAFIAGHSDDDEAL